MLSFWFDDEQNFLELQNVTALSGPLFTSGNTVEKWMHREDKNNFSDFVANWHQFMLYKKHIPKAFWQYLDEMHLSNALYRSYSPSIDTNREQKKSFRAPPGFVWPIDGVTKR